MQKTEIKTCPFCGGSVDLMWLDSEHQNEKRWEPCDEDEGVVFPFVRCSECDGTFVFDTPSGTGSAVTNAWNKRKDKDND